MRSRFSPAPGAAAIVLVLALCAGCATLRGGAAGPDLAAAIARITPSVVTVGDAAQALGSGFVVAPGRIVTAAHVVAAAKGDVVVMVGSERHAATVLKTDAALDVALLHADGLGTIRPLTFVAGPPRVGEWVVVIGNPFGAGITATAGIVSAAPAAIAQPARGERLQINAAINPGNSGGPICNTRGEVIGLASAFLPAGQGVGLATPAAAIQSFIALP